MTFKEELLQGIPAQLPAPKLYDPEVNHAPKRKKILSAEEQQLALKNALRYFDSSHHSTLLPEFKQELEADPQDLRRLQDEFGDMLFVMANIARHLKLDPETAIRSTNAKFERRFRYIEQKALENGQKLDDLPLDEMEAYWVASKTIVG